MRMRIPRNFVLAASVGLATFSLATVGRAWAAARQLQYWSCNWDKYNDVLMALPSGLTTFNVIPATGALVHCPIISDDTVSHVGPKAVITVSGRETSPTAGVRAIACVTFSSARGFFCAKPETTGAAFVGDYNLRFTSPFGDSYANDLPFVDVTLVMTGECCTSSLSGVTLSGP